MVVAVLVTTSAGITIVELLYLGDGWHSVDYYGGGFYGGGFGYDLKIGERRKLQPP